MLCEFFKHLRTPCPRPVKAVGYLREMIGLEVRHRRCRGPWQPHLQKCRDWIIQAMDDCDKRSKVVVLGSGLLNDGPLKELAQGFEQVVLVDILHMPSVRKAIRPFDNVHLDERDVTGFVAPLYYHGRLGAPLSAPDSANMDCEDADLVISLNILSQLAVLPMAYAEKKRLPLAQDIPARLLGAHLEALANSAGRVCLITEVEHRLCQNSHVIETSDPLVGTLIPQALKGSSKNWDWDFAPHPERHTKYDLVHRVEGYLR
jgi:hypothetical protein